jgi:hypothetical protein
MCRTHLTEGDHCHAKADDQLFSSWFITNLCISSLTINTLVTFSCGAQHTQHYLPWDTLTLPTCPIIESYNIWPSESVTGIGNTWSCYWPYTNLSDIITGCIITIYIQMVRWYTIPKYNYYLFQNVGYLQHWNVYVFRDLKYAYDSNIWNIFYIHKIFLHFIIVSFEG